MTCVLDNAALRWEVESVRIRQGAARSVVVFTNAGYAATDSMVQHSRWSFRLSPCLGRHTGRCVHCFIWAIERLLLVDTMYVELRTLTAIGQHLAGWAIMSRLSNKAVAPMSV